MDLKNSFSLIKKFKQDISLEIRKFYFGTSFYNKRISKIEKKKLVYFPNSSIFDCLVKYTKQKKNINEFFVSSMWDVKKINHNSFKKLHNFFWLYSIDLKSAKNITQSIIESWIDKNMMYSNHIWEIDILSKRIISWISNSRLTYEDASDEYKKKFNFLISKQVNHLINEINRSTSVNNKIIGCTAIILTGISYKENRYIEYGIRFLKNIISGTLDKESFPKSRNFRQLVFYLKYLILIRELFKEVYYEIPVYLDEAIFYLGQSYNLFWQTTKIPYLFNGNNENDYFEFDNYLNSHGYKFKSSNNEIAGYVLLNNKKNSLIVDIGKPPEKNFSSSYQSGVLSFEFSYLNKKIICNSGYFQKKKHQLNTVSRSSVAHSTLILDDTSISKFRDDSFGLKTVENSFKISDKKIIKEKHRWFINASHDAYSKNYGLVHNRSLEFFPEKFSLKGKDKIIIKKNFKSSHFEIRFHLLPEAKVTKTIDGKTVLIEIENSGWRFLCNDYDLDIETGLYFGKKNIYIENQNILISGITQSNGQVISWELLKI